VPKKRARLNCIAYFLSLIPYKRVRREKVRTPKRSTKGEYDDQATLQGRKFVPESTDAPNTRYAKCAIGHL
jgi:hypothetical protein